MLSDTRSGKIDEGQQQPSGKAFRDRDPVKWGSFSRYYFVEMVYKPAVYITIAILVGYFAFISYLPKFYDQSTPANKVMDFYLDEYQSMRGNIDGAISSIRMAEGEYGQALRYIQNKEEDFLSGIDLNKLHNLLTESRVRLDIFTISGQSIKIIDEKRSSKILKKLETATDCVAQMALVRFTSNRTHFTNDPELCRASLDVNEVRNYSLATRLQFLAWLENEAKRGIELTNPSSDSNETPKSIKTLSRAFVAQIFSFWSDD